MTTRKEGVAQATTKTTIRLWMTVKSTHRTKKHYITHWAGPGAIMGGLVSVYNSPTFLPLTQVDSFSHRPASKWRRQRASLTAATFVDNASRISFQTWACIVRASLLVSTGADRLAYCASVR